MKYAPCCWDAVPVSPFMTGQACFCRCKRIVCPVNKFKASLAGLWKSVLVAMSVTGHYIKMPSKRSSQKHRASLPMSFRTGHLSCALILIKKAIPDHDKSNHLGVYNSVKKTKAAPAPSAGAGHSRCPCFILF